MSSRFGVLALVVAIGALGVAAYGVSRGHLVPVDLDVRLEALENRVASLARRAERTRIDAPSLRGIEASPSSSEIAAASSLAVPMRVEDLVAGEASITTTASTTASGAAGEEAIQALVEEAVEKKAREVAEEMRVKENKKPSIGVLASMLDLTPEQVVAVEENVRRGQFEVHAILDTPTSDGGSLMDDLIDVVARGMAKPGTDVGWGRWIGRVMSEKVPGSDETYGTRIEAVKQSLRATFKRDWRPEQFVEFHHWGVDPTEIQGIPGSPNEALMERIGERARALGADTARDG